MSKSSKPKKVGLWLLGLQPTLNPPPVLPSAAAALNVAASLMGRRGGAAGRGQAKARTRQQAQAAARKRWRKK